MTTEQIEKRILDLKNEIHSLDNVKESYDDVNVHSIEDQIDSLKLKLTGDLFADMDIKDEIHNLEMKLNGVKPMDTHIDCVGCGS
jgi:uncharacterized protein Yka (UPF0111/DUF47 family)